MGYQKIQVPAGGDKITVNADMSLNVPNNPIIPFIEGDGIGIDISPVMIKVVDAAVAKARAELARRESIAGTGAVSAEELTTARTALARKQPDGIELLLRHERQFPLGRLAEETAELERMMNEARAVASLKSDHVVRVYDVARLANGTPYMVLELVDGPDLDRVLEASGPMSVDDAVAYMLAASTAATMLAITSGVSATGCRPTSTSTPANATSRRAMPPSAMIAPASTKQGMASSENLFTPLAIWIITPSSGRSIHSAPASAAMPSA